MSARSAIRQGDVLLVPATRLPEYSEPVPRAAEAVVLARGERTGHAHLIEDQHARLYLTFGDDGFDPPTWFLYVGDDGPATLMHPEHRPLSVQPGFYEVRQQREYVAHRSQPVRVID